MRNSGFQLRPEARRDMLHIWAFGADRWGRHQADAYARKLNGIFEMLAEMPGIGREHVFFDPPVRMHPAGVHMVVYTTGPDGVAILRVLGARQDWMAVLGGDA